MPSSVRSVAAARAAVTALAIVVYLGTLGHGFVDDDEIAVTRQQVVRESRFTDVFTTPYHAGTGGAAGTGLYRPLTVLSYVAQNALHGMHPGPFHAVNVVLHAAVSFLVLELALALSLPLIGALAAGALFALHPVHVEAVAGIAGRPELLAALFFVLSLVLFLRGRDETGAPTRLGLAGAALSFLLALCAKENAIVLPVVAIGAELLHRRRRTLVPTLLALGAAAAVYLAARAAVLGSLFVPAASVTFVENPVVGLTLPGRIATALAIAARYLVLLVFPLHLSPDWGFAQVVGVASPLDPWFLAGATAVLLGIVAAIAAARRHPAVSFSLLLGGAAWLIVSNIPVVIGVGMAERLLYLPSVGFCLLAGIAMLRLGAKAGGRVTAGLVGVVLLLAGARTWIGAAAWKDELTLFAAAESHAPRSVRVLGNLGAQLAARGRFEEARGRLERAAALLPEHVPTAINLSGVLLNLGELDAAEGVARRAIAVAPRDPLLQSQLGSILRRAGDIPGAANAFRAAIARDPSFLRARLDLASLLLRPGHLDEARHQLEKVLALEPSSIPALHGLGVVDLAEGRLAEAVRRFEAAARLAPQDATIAEDLRRAREAAGR